MVTVGPVPTGTETVFVEEHPVEFVPTTVYTVVTVGDTEMDEVDAPVFQLYEDAPFALMLTEPDPLHNVEGVATTLTVGEVPVFSPMVAVFEHPPSVAVTEYTVAEVTLIAVGFETDVLLRKVDGVQE